MVKNIVKDIMFLSQKSEKATEKDKYIAQDLLDTLKANKDRCVGLAANMIGYNKAIICISGGIYDFIMINPSITNKKEEYQNYLDNMLANSVIQTDTPVTTDDKLLALVTCTYEKENAGCNSCCSRDFATGWLRGKACI